MRGAKCPSYSCSAGLEGVRVPTCQYSTTKEYDSGMLPTCGQVPEFFLKNFLRISFHEGPGIRRFSPWTSESGCNPTISQLSMVIPPPVT